MTKRFILISPARSGSTMVRTALAAHPNILMHGEVMGTHRIRALVRAYLPEEYRKMEDEAFHAAMMELRSRDTRSFMAEVLFRAAGRKKVAGFKLITDQALSRVCEDACDWVAQQPDIHLIWLQRRNRLARYVSALLAKQGRVLVLKDGQVPEQTTTNVDPAEFVKDLHIQQQALEILRRKFRHNPSLDIVYEDVVDSPAAEFRRMFGFLGVNEEEHVEFQTKKINSDNLYSVIGNLRDIAGHPEISRFIG